MNREEFHYTSEEMVIELLKITPIDESDTVLDAGSGKNKVWYKNLKNKEKYECEIEDGVNFFDWTTKVDWVVGNPPFHIGWPFLSHAISIANKGVAFLGNLNFLNSTLLPNRLEYLADKGFYVKRIHIVQDKRWFGRYFYIIFTKEKNSFLTWDTHTYGDKANKPSSQDVDVLF